jgi:hypothetical protein
MTRSLRAMPLSATFRAMLRNAATIVREHSSFGSDSSAQQSAACSRLETTTAKAEDLLAPAQAGL